MNTQKNLAEDVHFRIMRLVHDNPEISQRELSDQVGISLGKVNYCISALIERGLVKIENFKNNRNKLQYMYLLTPAGVAEKTEITSRFLTRKLQEFELLKTEIEALQSEVTNVKPTSR